MQSRVGEAVRKFEDGYNCAQAVFATYADLFGMSKEEALRISSPLGAGMGRMREVCGAVSAMALLVGLKEGNIDPEDKDAQAKTYQMVRTLSDGFAKEQGSIICKELLGLMKRETGAKPAERTQEYYMTRPCSKAVACAAKQIEEQLLLEFCD